MKFVLLCSLIIISGCSYPHYQLQKLDNSEFKNKRCDKKIINIQEFIKPEETADFLKQIRWQNFSPDTEKNTVLNILHFTQKIKNTNDTMEFWQYPEETIQKGGDCEDKTFLLLSMLIQAGINDISGVKGRYLGQGHMWVEYKGNILDPSLKTAKLIPVGKSIGYMPFFKFDKNNTYYCDTMKGD